MGATGFRLRHAGAMRVLLVEDDSSIGEPLVAGLERHGYEVDWVRSAADALNTEPGDLVLLDLGLPDLDGQVVCRKLREVSTVPLIVVTARGDEIDRVALLDLGADDYLVKPFGFRELLARIRAVMRRVESVPTVPVDVVDVGLLSVDKRTRRVTVAGREVSLTPKEYDLLTTLAEDAGAVYTRDHLLRRVWDDNWWGSTKTLDVHVASLRRKLGDAGMIETVRGVGYRLAVGR